MARDARRSTSGRRSACACRSARCTCFLTKRTGPATTNGRMLMRHALRWPRSWPLALSAAPAPRRRPSMSSTAGDQNMVDYVSDYLGPMFEKTASGRQGGRGRHRPGRRAARRRSTRSSRRRRPPNVAAWDVDVDRGAPEDGRPDGRRAAAREIPRRHRHRQARQPRVRPRTRSARTSSGYVMPMFHSQTAIAYNPDLVKGAAEQLHRAGRLGEEEPEEVRLQRHQGRHVRRRLRRRLGLGVRRRRRQAREGPVRRAPPRRRGTSCSAT